MPTIPAIGVRGGMAKSVSTQGTVEPALLAPLAPEESVEGNASCLEAQPAFRVWNGGSLRAGPLSFRVDGDNLSLSQQTASVLIPISSVEAVGLESVFGETDALRSKIILRLTEGAGERTVVLGGIAATWARDYGLLVTALAKQGVRRFYTVTAGHTQDVSGRLRFGPAMGRLILMAEPSAVNVPQPLSGRAGWFVPWYQKETSPRVVRTYRDNGSDRKVMQTHIRDSARFGWFPSQTDVIPGHVNVGTLVVLIVTLPTIIIPLLCLASLRSPGSFVVTFDRRP